MDVKAAFLKCDLEEGIYMEQLKGLITQGKEYKVCRLIKSLWP